MIKKILSVVLVASMLILLGGCGENRKAYGKATDMMDGGNYEDAAEVFASLGDYKDSQEKVTHCQYEHAVALMNDKKFADAADAFAKLGNYKDSEEKAIHCKCEQVLTLLNDGGKVFEVLDALKAIGDYQEVHDQIEQVRKTYFFTEYEYTIPNFNVMVPDLKCTQESGEDESGTFMQYTYLYQSKGNNIGDLMSDTLTAYTDYFLEWIKLISELEGMSFKGFEESSYSKSDFILLYNKTEIGSISWVAKLTEGATITAKLYVT